MHRLLGFALVAATALPVAAQRVRYEGGAQVSHGRYEFTEPTTTLSLSTGLSLELGHLTVRATLPVWAQDSRLVTSRGVGAIPTGGVRAGRAVSDSGAMGSHGRMAGVGRVEPPADALTGFETAIADPLVQLTASLVGTDRVALRLTGSAKLPLADTSGFGTGEWDVGGGFGASLYFGRSFLGLDAAYWHFGDLDELELRDVASASASFGRVSPSGWGWLGTVRATTTIIDGYPPPVSIGAGVSRARGRGVLGLSLSVGLTELSPDVAVGTFWTVRL